ncbi:hypothetical protein [uncultured Pseudoteredinibacter sp.]|uniref:hypothetical protein n=1 Tax=uncultured Pseudoteredinibacter sp. TaxID=1641701 RepID=UPI00262CE560|nr:hypothetical protein [uncultured Pseudoteredinibacter sp.]
MESNHLKAFKSHKKIMLRIAVLMALAFGLLLVLNLKMNIGLTDGQVKMLTSVLPVLIAIPFGMLAAHSWKLYELLKQQMSQNSESIKALADSN